MSNLHVLNLKPIWVDQVNFIQITNLIQSNLIVKIKDTLLQTVGIAAQNGGENVANANRFRACFSYKCSQGGKNKLKVTPDAVSIKQLKIIFKLIKTKFWFAFYYCFFSQKNTTVPCLIHSSCQFLQDSFILSFPLKTCLAVCHQTAFYLTCYILIIFNYRTLHTVLIYAHQAVYSMLFKRDENRSSCTSYHFVPKIPTISSKRSKQY